MSLRGKKQQVERAIKQKVQDTQRKIQPKVEQVLDKVKPYKKLKDSLSGKN
jgi:ferritin-like metal-binding protein YciE